MTVIFQVPSTTSASTIARCLPQKSKSSTLSALVAALPPINPPPLPSPLPLKTAKPRSPSLLTPLPHRTLMAPSLPTPGTLATLLPFPPPPQVKHPPTPTLQPEPTPPPSPYRQSRSHSQHHQNHY